MQEKLNNIPKHIAVIMDGNGRWAQQRGLSRTEGHKEGAKAVERLLEAASKLGIKFVTLYCFSSENWSRPKSEIDMLFEMLSEYLDKDINSYREKGLNLSFIGQIDKLPKELVDKIRNIEKQNLPLDKEKGRVIFAISYGGREELAFAAKNIAKKVQNGELSIDDINENTISNNLYLNDVPDPDLLIRTSGELRISNFLIWQTAYTELYFTKTLWPDFNEDVLKEALEDYSKRNRRFGRV
ncbi:MAG: isoprenyl transferase [Alphaproteobacteria bacterium]|nr:isoprenyl transferase [Alphaproteobacteria bacterium]